MAATNQLGFLYLAYLSKPSIDRLVYRVIRQRRVRTIVELGVGIGQRARRMIEVAAIHAPPWEVRYAGIDLFEARSASDGPGMTLKTAHRLLTATGARIRLLPGDPYTALSRAANSLVGTDLVVVSSRLDPDSLARAWFYVPRMLGERSQVLIEEQGEPGGPLVLRAISREEIAERAAAALRRRAA